MVWSSLTRNMTRESGTFFHFRIFRILVIAFLVGLLDVAEELNDSQAAYQYILCCTSLTNSLTIFLQPNESDRKEWNVYIVIQTRLPFVRQWGRLL